MTAGSSGISAAGSAHPVIISRRRRPADSRPAACRIILIRDSGADGAISERGARAFSDPVVRLVHAGADDHVLDHRIAWHGDGTVGGDEDFEGGAFEGA